MGSALGGLPHNKRLDVMLGHKIVRLYKRDIGAGGGGVGGVVRGIDIWFQPAQDLGVNGLAVVRLSKHKCF